MITFGEVRRAIDDLAVGKITSVEVTYLVADYVAQEAVRARDAERELLGLSRKNPGDQTRQIARPGVSALAQTAD